MLCGCKIMKEKENLFTSFEEACSKEDFSGVESIIQQLQKLSEKNSNVNFVYSKAVVKAIETFKGRFSSLRIKELLANVEKIVKKNPNEEELLTNYAKILRFSLNALSQKGQPNIMKEIISYLENLAISNPNNVIIHEELSQASYEIVSFWKKRGDYKALREQNTKFRELAKKFPENELIKINLSKALVQEIESSNKRDIEKVDELLLEIQLLSESLPANEGLQLEWVHAYRTAMDRTMEKPDDAKRWLNSMKQIAANKKDEAFQIELAKGYLNTLASIGIQNIDELTKYLLELEMLADTSQENQELQRIFAEGLIISLQIYGVQEFPKTKQLMDKLKELQHNFPKDVTIRKIYVDSLTGITSLLVQDKKADEITSLLKELERLDQEYPEDQYIQQIFDQLSSVLKMIGYKRTKEKPRRLDYM